MTVKPNLIAGEWVGGAADPIRNVNPSDVSDVMGLHAAADAAQTELAVQAARAAFPAWARASIQQRFDLLDERLRDLQGDTDA